MDLMVENMVIVKSIQGNVLLHTNRGESCGPRFRVLYTNRVSMGFEKNDNYSGTFRRYTKRAGQPYVHDHSAGSQNLRQAKR